MWAPLLATNERNGGSLRLLLLVLLRLSKPARLSFLLSGPCRVTDGGQASITLETRGCFANTLDRSGRSAKLFFSPLAFPSRGGERLRIKEREREREKKKRHMGKLDGVEAGKGGAGI